MTIDYTKPYQPPQPPPPPQQFGAPPPPPPAKSSGCLKFLGIGCVVLIFAGIAFVVGIVYFVFHLIKNSDVYTESLHRAQQNAQVQSVLGTPIEDGWWVMGNVNLDNDRGRANITYPIEGSKGKGTVHVVASRSSSKWNYERMTVTPDDKSQRPIELLP